MQHVLPAVCLGGGTHTGGVPSVTGTGACKRMAPMQQQKLTSDAPQRSGRLPDNLLTSNCRGRVWQVGQVCGVDAEQCGCMLCMHAYPCPQRRMPQEAAENGGVLAAQGHGDGMMRVQAG